MARADGERTRARILEVSLPLFASRGYDGVGVRAIAEAADVNVATIAWHFGDKQGLYDEVVRGIYAELAALQPADVVGDDPLAAVLGAVWRHVRAREAHVRLLHRHLLDRGAHTAVAMDVLGGGLLAGLDAWLGAIAPGATRTELRLVAMTVLHLVVRLVLEPAEQFARIYATDDPRDEVVVAWLVRLARGLLRMVDAPDT